MSIKCNMTDEDGLIGTHKIIPTSILNYWSFSIPRCLRRGYRIVPSPPFGSEASGSMTGGRGSALLNRVPFVKFNRVKVRGYKWYFLVIPRPIAAGSFICNLNFLNKAQNAHGVRKIDFLRNHQLKILDSAI